MASRETERKTGNSGQGGGLGAPGSTGAYGARDPLGAPGSTGASRTTAAAPGYDPTEDMMGGHGHQQQQRRPAADDMGTGQGYTYVTAASMGTTTDTGYHAGVHVPHSTGLSGTYGTSGGFDTGGLGKSGGGEGFDAGMGERAHGMGRERGGGGGGGGGGGHNPEVASDTVVIESVGGLNEQDIGDQMDEWAQSIGTAERGRKATNDTGGVTKQRDGQRRG